MWKYPKKDYYRKISFMSEIFDRVKKTLVPIEGFNNPTAISILNDSITLNLEYFGNFLIDSCETFLIINSLYKSTNYTDEDVVKLTINNLDSINKHRKLLLDLLDLRNKRFSIQYEKNYEELSVSFFRDNFYSLFEVFIIIRDSFLEDLAQKELTPQNIS